MPPASASKPPPARKRQRKRKRRAASSSSSSSSSSDSDSSGPDQPAFRKVKLPIQAKKLQEKESSSSSSSSSDESSDSDSSTSRGQKQKLVFNSTTVGTNGTQEAKAATTRRARRSPSPDIPINTFLPSSFLPETGKHEDDKQKEDELKGKFRKLWMSSIADAFKDDLEVIQKASPLPSSIHSSILTTMILKSSQEPNMNPSRLAVLIESLASGADVFTSSAKPATSEVNEMEIIVNASEKPETTPAAVDADEDVNMADGEE